MFGLFNKKKKNPSHIDKYRIKVITLVDGTKKYYPQYKEDYLSSDWSDIIENKLGGIVFTSFTTTELTNNEHYHKSEDSALTLINKTIKDLEIKRAKEFLIEEIIKVK